MKEQNKVKETRRGKTRGKPKARKGLKHLSSKIFLHTYLSKYFLQMAKKISNLSHPSSNGTKKSKHNPSILQSFQNEKSLAQSKVKSIHLSLSNLPKVIDFKMVIKIKLPNILLEDANMVLGVIQGHVHCLK
jgi:hypothetical protein